MAQHRAPKCSYSDIAMEAMMRSNGPPIQTFDLEMFS